MFLSLAATSNVSRTVRSPDFRGGAGQGWDGVLDHTHSWQDAVYFSVQKKVVFQGGDTRPPVRYDSVMLFLLQKQKLYTDGSIVPLFQLHFQLCLLF